LAEDGASVAITYAGGQAKAEEIVRDIEAAGGKALATRITPAITITGLPESNGDRVAD